MVEVEEKRNGAGDATVHNQSKEKVGYMFQPHFHLKLILNGLFENYIY